LGDSPVGEASVVAGDFQPFGHGLVLVGQLAVLLFQCGVLGDQPLDGVGGEVVFQVADAAQEFADVTALGADLCVRCGECVFGVECVFPTEGTPAGLVGEPWLSAVRTPAQKIE
jgi:hypothetical protein